MSEAEQRNSAFSAEFIEAKKAENHPLKKLTTVVFEDEAEWAHFLEWVFDEYGKPWGLQFTNSPVPMTIRLKPELLEIVHDKFPMREVTLDDNRRHLASLKGTHPFDPEDLRGGHIPGLGYFRNTRKTK